MYVGMYVYVYTGTAMCVYICVYPIAAQFGSRLAAEKEASCIGAGARLVASSK